ncbi:MAG: tetratricopeptide repeat protein [Planctomycetota bacterium]
MSERFDSIQDDAPTGTAPADPVAAAEAPVALSDAQVRTWIARSRPHSTRIWWWRRWGLMAAMIGAIILVIRTDTEDSLARHLLPVGIMLGVLAFSGLFARQVRRIQRLYGRALTEMQLRQWPAALATLDQLMRRPIDAADVRSAALLWTAELATRAGEHDAAVAALDEVLAIDANEHHRQSAQTEKALALLRAGRLAEAAELLDAFRTIVFHEPMASVAEVGHLYHLVRTRAFEDAAARADDLGRRARKVFQRQAGYVFGLIALALEQVGQGERAQAYYDCATRLMSPGELGRRFAELAPLAQRLTPARSLL